MSDNKDVKIWEDEVKEKLNEFISNMLSVATECNMGTKYYHPEKERYETHIEYDEDKISAAEIRIVFKFVDGLSVKDINFV